MRSTADYDDSDIPRLLGGGFEESRYEQLDQEGMTEVVCAHLDLVAVFSHGGRDHADSRVADKEV